MANKKNMGIKIDYLSMVFDTATIEEVVGGLLGLPPEAFVACNAHIKHKTYTLGYKVVGIEVYGHPKPTLENPEGLGCYLVMKGHGCNEYQKIKSSVKKDTYEDEEEYKADKKREESNTFGFFFRHCHHAKRRYGEYHLTRIDIAIDDKNETPYFTVEQILKKCRQGAVISNSRSYDFHESKFRENDTAKTVNIGDRGSNQSYRFYDKDKEICQKTGKEYEEIGSWKRIEIQLRNETAQAFSDDMRENPYDLGEHAFGLLKNSLRFVIPDANESNRSRWKTCDFWNRFLGAVKPLKLPIFYSVNVLEDTAKWLEKGGAISAVKALNFLNQNQALGKLKSIRRMEEIANFSPELGVKIISHLQNQGRTDLIPFVQELTRK